MRPSSTERMRILCTGASGPYGAHFAKLALSKGHDVFSFRHTERPRDSASLLGIADQITWARVDIRDAREVGLRLAEWDIQAIAHFAAKPLVRTAPLAPEQVFSVNAGGTVALLEAAKAMAPRRKINFLHVSTDKVYGDAGDRPYTEDTPLLGAGVYEASKVAAEVACRAYQASGAVPNLVVSRSCNVVAVADLNWRLISNTTRQFLCGVPAKVYTQGQFVREYMHVEDAVEAQFLLMMRADEYAGQAFNIGSGHQMTQEEAIAHIRDRHFTDGHVIRVDPPNIGAIEIAYQRLDTTKIQRALGWTPQRTLDSAIADVVAWWKEHRELASWSLL